MRWRNRFLFGLTAAVVLSAPILFVYQFASNEELSGDRGIHPPPGLQYFPNQTVPAWMAHYIDFHQRSLTTSRRGNHSVKLQRNAPFLLSLPKVSGLGDRVRGILHALLTAMCHHRTFVLDWGAEHHDEIVQYLKPNLIQWDLPNYPHIPRGKPLFRQRRIIGAINVDETRIATKVHELRHVRGIGVISNQHWTQDGLMQSDTCLRDYWQRHGIPDPEPSVYYTTFWTLFRVSDALLKRVQQLQDTAQLTSNQPYIAMHVRAGGQSETFRDPVRHGPDVHRDFLRCAQALQKGLQLCLPDTKVPDIYLAADSTAVRTTIQSLDAATVRTVTNMTVRHVEKTKGDAGWGDLLAELYILMNSTCLVKSASTFSDMADWLSPHRANNRKRCALRFDQCGPQDVQQALANIGCVVPS